MLKDKQVSLNDVSRELDRGIAGADRQRAADLERLQVVRRAKANGLERERKRLSRKLGADHPRVLALAGKIEVNRGMMRDLAAETERAKTEIPSVDQNSWALHGYVRDRDLKGVPQLTVALYDQRGNWSEQLGYACTEKNGRFKIESRDVKSGAGRPVYIRVLNSQKVQLHIDKNPLTPMPGRVDYREIILSGEAEVCAPPGQTKDVSASASDAWVVRGRVTDKKGQALGGLVVSLYDRDLFFDDRLGQTETDAKGNFSFTYRARDFRDLIESKPDLYLKVMDRRGKALYTSRKTLRYEAGRVEVMDIKITKR